MEITRSFTRRQLLAAAALMVVAASWSVSGGVRAAQAKKKILVVSHTAGFRHDSIDVAKETLKTLGDQTGAWEVEYANNASDVASMFTADTLKKYDAVVFANTTGNLPITDDGKKAFLEWLRGGKGFIGMHAATDTFPGWPEYIALIGGNFDGHPWTQKIKVKVEDRENPATRHLGQSFEIDDEMYQFKDYKRADKHVLLSIDISSIDVTKGKREDKDYAVAWMKREGQGRVFYTSLGHRQEVWKDPRYQQHIIGGIKWALGLERARVPTTQ